MANGASRIFGIIKNTADENKTTSELATLAVKSLSPLVFKLDEKTDITSEFYELDVNFKMSGIQVGDIVKAIVLNDKQLYYILSNVDTSKFGVVNTVNGISVDTGTKNITIDANDINLDKTATTPISIKTKLDSLVPNTITNNNGTAIKFADGTMICTKTIDLTGIGATTASGSLYRTDSQSLGDYAESFTIAPILQLSLSRGSAAGWIGNVSSVGKTFIANIIIYRPTSTSSADYHIEVTAVGRWK